MATVPQIVKAPRSDLTPELKAWLDRVIVPTLVREYLAAMEVEKDPRPIEKFSTAPDLAAGAGDEAQSSVIVGSSAEGVV